MEYTIYRLGDIAEVKISGVDKKTHDEEVPVRLCNFVDVYYNWAITKEMTSKFMAASANDKEIESFTLHRGQVAITKDSETRDDIGIAAYIADDFEETVLLGYHTALITPNEEVVNGKFLNALLHSKYFHDYWFNNATGSGMRYTLSEQCIRNASVYLPSLDEQKKIGNVLSSLDRKIALNRKANELLESMAKQLYDYWFVQFDFPNAEGKPYKSSGGKMVYNETLKRDIPEGWEVKTINEISKSVRGVTYDRTDLLDDGILVLRGNNIQDNHLVYDGNTAYIPEHLVNENQTIKKGDIIMTMSSGSKEHIGKCMMFNYNSNHTFGAFLNCFRPEKELQYYFFLFLISSQYKAIIKSKCSGTGINNLTNQSFDDIYLPIPHSSILASFESKMGNIYEMYGKNEQENLKLESLRDYLLPLLMNGQVKVS